MITAITLEPLNLGSNYTEILIEPEIDVMKLANEKAGIKSVFELKLSLSFYFELLKYVTVITNEHALTQPKVQEIINAKQTEGVYDLLLVEQLHQEPFLALAHIYKIPVVSSATFAQQSYFSQMFGVVTPWSYVPMEFLPYSDRMNFFERAVNSLYTLRVDLNREFDYFPALDALVQKHFGHLPIKFPSVSAMEKNHSAIVINSYAPLANVMPKMDNMVYIGGLHIYPTKPLPTDLQKFLDDAEHGAIYFSFGTMINSKDMPAEKLDIFLNVFRQLKQRILWKFENDSIPNLPANVRIKDWLPQNDILEHPNMRAFISHGGLFGLQEAVVLQIELCLK
ncbi:UDP-glycosyltransferase UGT4-like [Rhagoletis pomonella]|uniref:UDP-glycosyltransferase UGT4-like n=1 Tax=Rhagoletis pomonella TaxID=28610 RepID=UPI00177CAB63|nr:UDP-glycosyltransferase UGT4-like [Rhagoletis pomonella]